MEQDQVYSLKQLGLFENLIQKSQSGRMFQALSHQMAVKILEQSSRKCSAPMFQCLDLDDGQQQGWLEVEKSKSPGGYSMPNISEWPNDAVVSSLSQVLEANAPQKYYLSKVACAGILRRAGSRGKKLPALLESELLRVATNPKE